MATVGTDSASPIGVVGQIDVLTKGIFPTGGMTKRERFAMEFAARIVPVALTTGQFTVNASNYAMAVSSADALITALNT